MPVFLSEIESIRKVRVASIYDPPVDKRPVAERLGHMAADHAEYQNRGKHGRYQIRPHMDDAEQTYMDEYHDSPSLVEPMAAMVNFRSDEGTACQDGKMMPRHELDERHFTDSPAEQHAGKCHMSCTQNDIDRTAPGRAFGFFPSDCSVVVVNHFFMLSEVGIFRDNGDG